jgi:AraC-like DNA-binding protein
MRRETASESYYLGERGTEINPATAAVGAAEPAYSHSHSHSHSYAQYPDKSRKIASDSSRTRGEGAPFKEAFMDVLTGVMGLLRTKGYAYGRMELSGRFGLRFPNQIRNQIEVGLAMNLGATNEEIEATIHAHPNGTCLLVTRGSCFLNIDGGVLAPLVAGDFVFLRDETWYLRSDKNIAANKTVSAEQKIQYQVTKRLAFDNGGGAPVSLIVGCFMFSSPESRLLVEQLPKVMHLKYDDAGPWTRALFQLINKEIAQERPGTSSVIDRVAEVLLLHAIRNHFWISHSSSFPSWLKALSDQKIGKSLQAMHGNLKSPWTVEQLARGVGMSRSAFASRFKQVVGKTPLDHLTEWRMAHAARLIRDSQDMKLDSIAQSVGYESESSFRKAFRKVMKHSPSQYRKVLSEAY